MFKPFSGFLTQYTGAVNQDMQTLFKFNIKYVDPSTVQVFLDSLDNELHLNYRRYVQEPVYWNSISFKNLHYKVSIEIEGMEFDAKIVELAITRKVDKKTGDDTFTYIIKCEKEAGVDNEDSIIAQSFLNVKEEDENGKKKLVPFGIVFKQRD